LLGRQTPERVQYDGRQDNKRVAGAATAVRQAKQPPWCTLAGDRYMERQQAQTGKMGRG